MDPDSVSYEPPPWTKPLGGSISLMYDAPSDILYLDACPSNAEQEIDQTDEDAIIRGEVELTAELAFGSRGHSRPAQSGN